MTIKQPAHIAVIGLGYVGIPLAIELAKEYKVKGFDISQEKVQMLQAGIDVTKEVGSQRLRSTSMVFTYHLEDIKVCNVYIIAVPTPIHSDKTPDLEPVKSACEMVASVLKVGDLVILESTVYPGTTEEICIPLLQELSGLTLGKDFQVGYSPERVNPGDQKYSIRDIVKVVSGSDEEALERVDGIYSSIIDAGTHRVSSIKVAEAAKIIENAQRDINIAFMNELSMIFNSMDIDTSQVIEAASTKWNFLKFYPGLVGGHCIGVDPYYFIYKAEQLGYHSQIMTAGRRINNSMSSFIVKNIVKELLKTGNHSLKKIGVLGMTFKENCPDSRNTRVIDVVEELQEYGVEVLVYDPIAERKEVKKSYGIDLVEKSQLKELDTVVIAVAHDIFKEECPPNQLKKMLRTDSSLIFDLKSLYANSDLEKHQLIAWRL
ncbi:nucleotide sugar dehydrogenase [Alkalihalobacillus trypoxylicola]|uniref:UDP-N-acetyl-D-galactosamine dehydrogenase n=1 Tax=Alkalihalobacillus trypoxylicola TaxID=519424 RepID=A0A162DGL0_9BACI|nr:nucleotide sugar dehydrogenase [Alkalihalobacillus trypoxylicola]KYG29566.1 UDP-N-acetyl-D-galactosamine dehydrogenase [Alkalihalobacillus trypoxylicola]